MSVVTLSRERREAIKRHIRGMAVKDLATMVPAYKEKSEAVATDLITRLHFYPHHSLVEKVPLSEWCRPIPEHCRVINVLPREPKQIKQHYGGYAEEHVEPLFQVSYPQATGAYWRPGEGTKNRANEARITVEQLGLLAADPEWQLLPGFSQLTDNLFVLKDVAENRKKWETIETQLTTLLDQVKTVNAAAKVFPQIKFYLPDNLLAQYNERREKAEARVIDTAGLDLEALTVAGVSHALAKSVD